MEYVLCHHVYRCTPHALGDIDEETALLHLAMFDAEAWYRTRKSKTNGTPPPNPTP